MPELILAVFASGGGSNLQALIDSSKKASFCGKIAVVISNNSGAFALERARSGNIPAFHISGKTEPDGDKLCLKLLNTLEIYRVNLIVLAGYMKLMPLPIIRKYRDRIINIHPALLPRYGGRGMYGLNVHRAVLDSGERYSGATVHFVDEAYDRGPILLQRTVPVNTDDTPESLAARVLEVEHKILPQAVEMFS